MYIRSLARAAVILLTVGALTTGYFALIHDDFALGLGATGFAVVAALLWRTARGRRKSSHKP